MAKSFDTFMAESGQQSTLDSLKKSGKYDAAAAQYDAGGAGSSDGGVASIWDDPAKLNEYLGNYQTQLLGTLGNSDTPTAKAAFTTEELQSALMSKAGMTAEQAAAAAAGSDANSLATKYLGYNVPGNSGNGVSYSQIASQLTPNTDMPEALNRVEMFGEMRQAYGVDGLESNLTDLKAAQNYLFDQLRINTAAEKGKPVATNIIEGRVSEQQRNIQEQTDFIARQISNTVDQLNSAYNVINMYMNFASLDYQDAVTRYNTEFAQSMEIFSMLRGIRSDALGELKTQSDVQFQKENLKLQQQDSARANLQIMANAITSGNMDPGQLTADQKTQMAKLETQSGLPVGFVSSLGLSNKDKIISTTTDNGVTQVITQDAKGNISVKKVGTSTAKQTQAEKTLALNSNAAAAFATVKGPDGFVDPKDYKIFRQVFVDQGGGTTEEFDKKYAASYVNPTAPEAYGVSAMYVDPDRYKN